jgi:EAL domain-containing protein (putative c-di-GMP-specific phosphodiesterase class I)
MSTGSIMTTADEVWPLRESRTYRAFFAAAITAPVSGASTGCRLVAEGVETEEEARTRTVLGVAFGRGYLSERPEPAPKAEAGARASGCRAGWRKGADRA